MRCKLAQEIIDKLRHKDKKNENLLSQEYFKKLYFKTKFLDEQKENITDLYLGLSYGMHGINPDFLSRHSFNYCFPSMDLYTSYRCYLHICDFLPNLKNIYIASAYYAGGHSLNKSMNEHEKSVLLCYNLFWDINITNPLLFKDLSYIKKLTPPSDIYNNGYIELNGVMNNDVELRFLPHKKIYYKYGAGELIWLQKLKNVVDANRHTLTLLLLPFNTDYTNKVKKEIGNDYNQLVLNYAKKNSINILDFSSLKLDSDCFYDPDHMNKKGAEEFTKILNQNV